MPAKGVIAHEANTPHFSGCSISIGNVVYVPETDPEPSGLRIDLHKIRATWISDLLKEATRLEMDFSSPGTWRNEILILTRNRNCPSDKGLTLAA
jgi:hypothetical protein